MPETISQVEFFDPFAEEGEQTFDPIASMEAITARYLADEVEHDASADQFVAETQALILDAQFAGKFNEAVHIAEMAHLICGEDHAAQQSLYGNESARSTIDGLVGQDAHAGHDHGDAEHGKNGSNKNTKGKNKKKKFRRWFSLEHD